MANFEIPENLNFTEEIRKLEVSDPGHADLFNETTRKLFENALFLRKMSNDILAGIDQVDNTSDINKPVSDDTRKAIDEAYASSNGYADNKIAQLINGAPSTLDTLKELADAILANKSVADALDAAIGKKANQAELDTHTGNGTIHVTTTKTNKWDGYDAKITKNAADIGVVNRDLGANGAIIRYDVVNGDGVYINYKDGADTVRKKLGSANLIQFSVSGFLWDIGAMNRPAAQFNFKFVNNTVVKLQVYGWFASSFIGANYYDTRQEIIMNCNANVEYFIKTTSGDVFSTALI